MHSEILNEFIETLAGIKTNESQGDYTHYPNIKNVIYNPPATIVFWEDGTKTVVKCREEDTYNKELGLLYCIAKDYFGNDGMYKKVLKEWCWNDMYGDEEPNIKTVAPIKPLYDEKTIFENPEIKGQLEALFQNKSIPALANMYDMLNKWQLPKDVAEILDIPDFLFQLFATLPDSIKAKTTTPLMEILQKVMIKKTVKEFKTQLAVIHGTTWEEYISNEH